MANMSAIHAAGCRLTPLVHASAHTSILPVTAAEIRAVRQSRRILPVVVGGIAFGVAPAVLAQVIADGGFEMVFLVDGVDHGGR